MFEIGKIPSKILEEIVMHPIQNNPVRRKEVILRPEIGEDCAALDTDGEFCVFSTDPITGAVKDIGYLAVQINCNDIFSSGAEPIGILLTVLLPPQSDEEMLEEIMNGAFRAAQELGIEILGGHTEVTDAVCKPLISATVLGKSKNRKILTTGGAKVGQDVVMTKWAGIEGTAILAKERAEELSRLVSAETIGQALELAQLLSVGKESRIASAHGASAMHDATEGGVLGAVWEMAECSGVGVEIYEERIPIKDETRAVCEAGKINPLRLISSGVMVIATEDGEELVEKLEKEGIHASVIGKMIEKERVLYRSGVKYELDEPYSDELYSVDFRK